MDSMERAMRREYAKLKLCRERKTPGFRWSNALDNKGTRRISSACVLVYGGLTGSYVYVRGAWRSGERWAVDAVCTALSLRVHSLPIQPDARRGAHAPPVLQLSFGLIGTR